MYFGLAKGQGGCLVNNQLVIFWVVLGYQKSSDSQGDFTGVRDDGDYFGNSAVALGDVDGDGDPDLVFGTTDWSGNGVCQNRLYLNDGRGR
ncbi:MAG: hypothetical protein GY954_07750, partial [Alteromonas sp.]|nr:hypothetical protein [Alteromonas sp.]